MKDLQERYLPDIARESFTGQEGLRGELDEKDPRAHPQSSLKYDRHPQSRIENLLSSLSAQHSQSSSHTILLVDEVEPLPVSKDKKGDGKADWSSLKSKEGVDFIVALSTYGASETIFKVIPPTDSRVLCQRLTTPHRNCAQVGTLFKFYIQHLGRGYLSGMEEDKQALH